VNRHKVQAQELACAILRGACQGLNPFSGVQQEARSTRTKLIVSVFRALCHGGSPASATTDAEFKLEAELEQMPLDQLNLVMSPGTHDDTDSQEQ